MRLGKQLLTRTLATNGDNASVLEGDFRLEKNKLMQAIAIETTATLANSTGAAIDPSAADASAFLSGLLFSMTYGKGKQKPWNSDGFDAVRRACRSFVQADFPLVGDTSTGLRAQVPTSGTKAVKVWLIVPTGVLAQLRGTPLEAMLGIGPSQARSMKLEFKRADATLDTAGLTVKSDAAVTMRFYPLERDANGDVFSYLPVYEETTEEDDTRELPDGLWWELWERSSAHSATDLDGYDLRVDDRYLFEDMDPADVSRLADLADADYPAGADNTGEVVDLMPLRARTLEAVPTGRLHFKQTTSGQVSPLKFAALRTPIPTEDEVRADVAAIAAVRGKRVKAVNRIIEQGVNVPIPQAGLFGAMVAFDESDSQYERFPGLVSGKDDPRAAHFMPPAVMAASKARVAALQSAGQTEAANKVAELVALAIPGAVRSGRGFHRGRSAALEAVKAALGL